MSRALSVIPRLSRTKIWVISRQKPFSLGHLVVSLCAVNRAFFRFYAELNDFLPAGKRGISFAHSFGEDQSVKHLVEALGVPHTEVDLILVDGTPVNFATLIKERERGSVYPRFRSIDLALFPDTVRPPPLQEFRFVLDGHLGRLAAYLRMTGFDTLYRNDYEDEELARVSRDQGRILLTRDRGLLKRSAVAHGYWLRETDPRRQLVELLRRYDLYDAIDPFSRCMSCNGLLRPVAKEAINDRLPPKTRQYYHHFQLCNSCDKLYWDGPHVRRMRQLIAWAVQCGRTRLEDPFPDES